MQVNFDKRYVYYALGIVALAAILSSDRFWNLYKRTRENLKLRGELHALTEDNDTLRRRNERLRGDNAYQEFLIRRDLGYIKPGEFEDRYTQPEKTKK